MSCQTTCTSNSSETWKVIDDFGINVEDVWKLWNGKKRPMTIAIINSGCDLDPMILSTDGQIAARSAVMASTTMRTDLLMAAPVGQAFVAQAHS